MTPNTKRAISWGSLVLMLAILWLFVLPPQLGGRTIFLTTRGISMEPLMSDGDLVILRTQPSYQVGDVVQYHSEALNAPVLHRIVSIENGLISTRGDNNNFIDLDHPTNSDINGKMVHVIANGGKYVDWLKSTPARIIGFGLIAWAAYSFFRGEEDEEGNKKRRRIYSVLKVNLPTNVPLVLAKWLPQLQIAFLVFTAFCLVFTVVAFTKPTTTADSQQLMYSIRGKFAYSATATGGDLVYRDGQVSTGDPIYTSMVKELFITFNYELSAPGQYKGGGEIALQATIKGQSGWTHPIPLSDTLRFTGNTVRVSSVLNIQQILDVVSQVYGMTSVKESGYTVLIQPTVRLDGELGGEDFKDTFQPMLTFGGDTSKLAVPPVKGTDGPQGSNTNGTSVSGIEVGKGGSITIPPQPTAQLQTLGMTLGVTALRIIGIIMTIIGAALSAASYFLRRYEHLKQFDAAEVIVETHRDMFVPVNNISLSDQAQIVDVANLDALTRIAEQHELPILHQTGDRSIFVFNHGSLTYRYVHKSPGAQQRFGTEKTKAEAAEAK